MRLDKLTTKFQEALGEAQSLALGKKRVLRKQQDIFRRC